VQPENRQVPVRRREGREISEIRRRGGTGLVALNSIITEGSNLKSGGMVHKFTGKAAETINGVDKRQKWPLEKAEGQVRVRHF